MADINQEQKYLLYGQDEISQQDLMTGLANDLPTYLSSKRWLQNPKYRDKWMAAYQDIINHGITGASSESGQWKIKYNGDKIDTDSMSNIDKEIYADAAWYIQNKMSQMTPRKKEEEVKKELEPFDFKTSFGKQLLNLYGGDSSIFSDSEQGWNSLDARGNDGLRGTKERRRVMAEQLELYKKDLEGKDYNFEGTPFKDKNDALTKLQKAIDALGTNEESDDLPAFSALGLNYRNFFSNGGNEYTNNINPQTGNPYTYSQWNQLQKQQAEDKAKQAAALKEANYANQYKNYKYYNYLNGTPSNQEDFNNIALKLANNQQLDGNDISRISWAFRQAEKSGGLQNLSKEELQWMPRYVNNPSRLKKINGLDGIYYDSIARRIVQPQRELNSNGITLQSILDQNSPEALDRQQQDTQQQYLNNTEFTDADWAELGGMALDIASIVDPEPWTAGAMGLAAAGARNYARTRGPQKWGFWDYASQAGDYLTGVAGAIPILGDAALIAKTTKNIVPWLRRAMRVPAFLDLWNSTPELGPIGKKLFNGEDLTVKDWMTLGTFVRGLATTRNLNVTNRASRKALQKRGYQVSNRWDKKLGVTQSKPINESVQPTLKINIKGTNEEIPISKELKQELDVELSKAGNDIAKRNKILKENAKVQKAVEQHMQKKDPSFKIKEEITADDGTKSTKISNDWNNSSAVYNESLRNARLFGQRFGILPSSLRTSGGTFGETINPLNRGTNNFDTYLSSNRGAWERLKYGSNRTLKRMDKYNQNMYESSSTSSKREKWADIEKGPSKWTRSKEAKEYEDMLRGKFGTNSIQGGVHKIGDLTIDVDIPRLGATNGFAEVSFKDGSKQTIRFDTQRQLQEQIAKIIKERRVQMDSSGKKVKVDVKEMSKILKSLKAKGLLKQGGQINPSIDTIIKDFIKNNNI